MTWFKVDDSFYDHPKVFDLPDSAVAWWVRAGSWSARNLQDGFVPTKMPARFCDDPEAAVRALVDRGLWRRTRGGYQFHDWTDYQPTREEATAAKEKKSSGGRIGNHRRWHVDRGISDPDCPYCQGKQGSVIRSDSDRYTEGVSESAPNPPVPSRPDPDTGGSLGAVGAGSQSVRERARELEAARYIRDRYGTGLTDTVIALVIAEARDRANRTGKPVKHMLRYLGSWAEGELADVVKAAMDQADRQERPPPAAPEPLLYAVPDHQPEPEPGPPPMPPEQSRALAHASTCKTLRCSRCEDIADRWPDLLSEAT